MDRETRLKLAVAALKNKDFATVKDAAFAFDVPRSTLSYRYNGGKSRTAAHTHEQRCTVEEEAALERLIKQWYAWGFPVTIKVLNDNCRGYLPQKA